MTLNASVMPRRGKVYRSSKHDSVLEMNVKLYMFKKS